MKHFIIRIKPNPTETFIQVQGKQVATSITSSAEGWRLEVTTIKPDGHAAEQAHISMLLPGQQVFNATVQDVISIPSILQNTKATLMNLAGGKFSDKVFENEVLTSIEEINHLLGLFKKG